MVVQQEHERSEVVPERETCDALLVRNSFSQLQEVQPRAEQTHEEDPILHRRPDDQYGRSRAAPERPEDG